MGFKALSACGAAVFFEAWHDLDQIAGPVAHIELVFQNAVPGVAAGSG
jgi:hypothetical protein